MEKNQRNHIVALSILALLGVVGVFSSMHVYYNDLGASEMGLGITFLSSIVTVTLSMMSIEEVLKKNKR